MACTERRSDQIQALATGRIDLPDADDLLEHLADCGPCSDEFDAVADLVAAAESAAERDAVAVASPAQRHRARSVLLLAATAAAAVIVAAVLLFGADEDAGAIARLASIDPLPVLETRLRAGEPAGRGADWAAAMVAYAGGDYRAAARDLDGFVAAHEDDRLAQLYLGICLLQLGAPAAAEDQLARAAAAEPALLRQHALWYLANAHLLLDDAPGAIAVLEQLRDLGADYEINATRLLEAVRIASGR